ncbi:adenosine deaminase [Rhodococcus sp. ACPA4]|uniref:adenosine deaminase n=1 Tax=Rhodococcus TaxID=1827 RepID=UPI000BB13655|nr:MULTISPECIES: adenosine deaminase [Rhodococcus]MCE4264515.1 adenosine deaminase [Rhodococcus globerulus]PBC37504.1 adenosine deaminase [Rhodococcus sp. ACPA4]
MRADADFLRSIPKVELHCHLEGAVPATTAIALARKNGIRLPTYDPELLYTFADLPEFLTVYRAVCASMVTARDFAEIAYAAQEEGVRTGNLRYRELFINPTNHHVPYPEMLEGIIDGLRCAEEDFGVVGRVIPAINREQSPSMARELVEAVIEYRRDEVLGIGLDHNDALGPPELFVDAFQVAANAGLRRTAHAGEIDQRDQVIDSIELLGCERIDHGYAVMSDPVAVEFVRDAGTHFAGCWSSCAWFHPGLPQHSLPIAAMLRAGLPVSINSDDPPMFGTGIGNEYVLVGKTLGWTRAQAIQAAVAAVDGSWMDASDKAALRREIEDAIHTP